MVSLVKRLSPPRKHLQLLRIKCGPKNNFVIRSNSNAVLEKKYNIEREEIRNEIAQYLLWKNDKSKSLALRVDSEYRLRLVDKLLQNYGNWLKDAGKEALAIDQIAHLISSKVLGNISTKASNYTTVMGLKDALKQYMKVEFTLPVELLQHFENKLVDKRKNLMLPCLLTGSNHDKAIMTLYLGVHKYELCLLGINKPKLLRLINKFIQQFI